jgi:hypothetical protein
MKDKYNYFDLNDTRKEARNTYHCCQVCNGGLTAELPPVGSVTKYIEQ